MLKNCCVAIQSRELSVVMNDVWNVLDRVGRGESGENNIHLLMSVLEQLLCYDERHWRLKRRMKHNCSTPSSMQVSVRPDAVPLTFIPCGN